MYITESDRQALANYVLAQLDAEKIELTENAKLLLIGQTTSAYQKSGSMTYAKQVLATQLALKIADTGKAYTKYTMRQVLKRKTPPLDEKPVVQSNTSFTGKDARF